MNNQDKQLLLEKAARDYPAGTDFISAFSKKKFTSLGIFSLNRRGCISVKHEKGKVMIYYKSLGCNGQWAEIVYKPEEDIMRSPEWDKFLNPKKYEEQIQSDFRIAATKNMQPIQSIQPIDLENDPRYKELLVETSEDAYNKSMYATSISFYEWSGTWARWTKIKLEAQRRYFEEKLAEKDLYCGVLEGLIRGYEKEVPELTSTIVERDKEIEMRSTIPTWYSENEFRHHLSNNRYSKEIQDELSKMWSESYQASFEKGFIKGRFKIEEELLTINRQLLKYETNILSLVRSNDLKDEKINELQHTLLLRNLSDLTLEDYPDGLESIGHQSDYRDENGNIREFVFIDEANQYIELLLKHNKNE